MRRREIFNQAVIGRKKYISKQNCDMCFAVALQKNNLFRKDTQASAIFLGREEMRFEMTCCKIGPVLTSGK